MQLNREGVDDSLQTAANVNLEKHFKEHGLSSKAYDKISDDISSGDMNVDILVKFNENELLEIANTYSMTILQKKAFIEAVKLLPNSKAASSQVSKGKHGYVYVSPHEQKIFDEMQQLNKIINDFEKKCKISKTQNIKYIQENIKKLEMYRNKIKKCVDDTIDTFIKKVK